jgi:hypothetical protein
VHLSSNRDFDLDTSLNVDDDLLDDLGRSVKTAKLAFIPCPYNKSHNLLNQTFVNSHLESIPGLGTFSTGCLSGGDLESLGRETNGALDAEFLALGTLDELLADLLEGLDFAGGQGDANLMGFLRKIIFSGTFSERKEDDLRGLRRTPSLAFGRTFWRMVSFTTRTLSYGKVMKVIVVVVNLEKRRR